MTMTIQESAAQPNPTVPALYNDWLLYGSKEPDDPATFDARIKLSSICDAANLRQPRWLDGCALFNIIDDSGVANLTDREFRIFADTDLALVAVSKADDSRQFVLIGCYDATTDAHIRRSRSNADHFAHITGCATHAVIIGKPPPSDILEFARRHQVLCLKPKQRTPWIYTE